MVFPPRGDSNNDFYRDDPQSELDLLEGLLNSMISGTTMLFKTIQDPVLVEIDSSSRPSQQQHYPAVEDLDGSDFRRIAEKRRHKQGESVSMTEDKGGDIVVRQEPNNIVRRQEPKDVVSIVNKDRYFENEPSDLFSLLLGGMHRELSSVFRRDQDMDDQATGWHFSSSSTSQQRTVQPDGTEETVITTKRNGHVERITRVTYPDGTIQETRDSGDTGSTIFPSLLSPSQPSPTSVTPTPSTATSNGLTTSLLKNNPLSNWVKSFWGETEKRRE